MVNLHFEKKFPRALNVLCLGAHSDDIEIGCGGTILKLLAGHPNVVVNWVVFSAVGQRQKEARNCALRFLKTSRSKVIRVMSFEESVFPFIGSKIKKAFEEIKSRCQPDLIFTHHRHDLHQDHRVISDLTWNTFRDHLILEYEIPKYDGDLGTPNVFVPIPSAICKAKVHYLLNYFETQRGRHWFTEDTFMSMLRIRGIESGRAEKYAEAFYCRKIQLF